MPRPIPRLAPVTRAVRPAKRSGTTGPVRGAGRGVAVTAVEYMGSQPWPFPRSLMLGYRAWADGSPALVLQEDEIAEARWFTRDDFRRDLLDGYSATALKRVWRAEHFSWWMTSMLHRFPDQDAFQHRLQLSELNNVVNSRAAATMLAENYVGMPIG